jgi:saccharopine dehydrogenase (NAD+, L-lysine-forming)
MSAPRVVILGGAGAMGRITAQDLLRTARDRVHVVVADRELEPARRLGVECVPVDVRDPASLDRALKGAFAVIASLPYRFNLDAMRGALRAGAHYLDLGGLFHVTRQQLELRNEFKAAGRMALLGIGSAPGIVNLLAVHAAQNLDVVRDVHCLVGSVDRTRYRNVPPLGFDYSADTLLDEFTMESAVFRDGEFRMVPPLDPRERIEVRFPAPIGTLTVDTTLHSEVATLPLSFRDRGVEEVTFRQSFDAEFLETVRVIVQLGLADAQPIRLGAAPVSGPGDGSWVSPRSVLLALLRRFPPAEAAGPPSRHEVLRALVRGRRGGRPLSVAADCYAGPKAGGGVGPDLDTGAPPSIAVQLMVSGELPIKPGVWAPEQVVPVDAFVRELERRGMPVRRHVVAERVRRKPTLPRRRVSRPPASKRR